MMKPILENWNRFVHRQSKLVPLQDKRKRLLNEISYKNAEAINDWFGGDYSKLALRRLFDDKLRYSFPLQTQDERYLLRAIKYLIDDNWMPPENEDDASWAKRRFSTKVVKQKLRKLDTGEEYEVDVEVPDLKLERSVEREIPKGPRAGEIVKSKEVASFAKAMAKAGVPKPLMQWWERAQGHYTKNSGWKAIEDAFISGGGNAGIEYSVVVSRHPMDVLRMSDIGNIKSCHSEGASYFQCAVAESRGHGAVVYLIPTDELKEFLRVKGEDEEMYGSDVDMASSEETEYKKLSDFDDQEIFRDSARGVDGIVAKARVRLRRLELEGGYMAKEFAIPELATYGSHPAGFVQAVSKDTWERQKDLFVAKSGRLHLPSDDELKITGGTYRDTTPARMLNNFFSASGEKVDKYHGFIETEGGEEELENLWEMYETEIEEHNARASNELEHAWFHGEVDGHDEPYVTVSAGMSITVPLSWEGAIDVSGGAQAATKGDVHGQEKWVPNDQYNLIPNTHGDYKASGAFESLIKDISDYPESMEWSIGSGTETPWEIEFQLYYNCDDCYNPDNAGYFLDYIRDDIDKKHDVIKEKIRKVLIENGYMPAGYFDELEKEEENREKGTIRFENFAFMGDENKDGTIEFILRYAEHDQTESFLPTGLRIPLVLARSAPGEPPIYDSLALMRAGLGTKKVQLRSAYSAIALSPLAESEVNKRLASLEKAANEHISRQFHLDLGDGWEPKVFSGVENLNRAVFSVYFMNQSWRGSPTPSEEREIGFNLRIQIRSTDTKEEINIALEYISFIDRHVEEIKRTVADVFSTIMESKAKEVEKEEREFFDGTTAKGLIMQIYRSNATLMNTDEGKGRVKIAKWVAENWSTMSDDQKRISINQYLVPIVNRSYGDNYGINLSSRASDEPTTPSFFSGYLPVGHGPWAGTDYKTTEIPSWDEDEDIEQGRGLGKVFECVLGPKTGLIRLRFKRALLG